MIIKTTTTATAIEIILRASTNANNFLACSIFPPNRIYRPSFHRTHSLPYWGPQV